jgi:hypothetical protein
MPMKNEEKKPLTIYDRWNKDSEEPNGGIGFDDSEWDGMVYRNTTSKQR